MSKLFKNSPTWIDDVKNAGTPKLPTSDDNSINSVVRNSYINFSKKTKITKNTLTPIIRNGTIGFSAAFGWWGGVLDTQGNIHLVPFGLTGITRGQLIRPDGTSTTYSLVYTGVAQAYSGGVLASNGDIHFVPRNAVRGQKVSSSGVVSTYSLVYTVANAYGGGVLAPNGDIHFVPSNAVVGQKISPNGTVSTYSLAYTIDNNAYSGGVLDNKGDIHFVPSFAAVGQKVTSTGVTTYAIPSTFTNTQKYLGGFLDLDGNVIFYSGFMTTPSTNIVKVDKNDVATEATISFSGTAGTPGSVSSGCVLPNGDYIFLAIGSGYNIVVDSETLNIKYIFSQPSPDTQSYRGCVINKNGDLFHLPYNSNAISILSLHNFVDNPNFALHPIFSARR